MSARILAMQAYPENAWHFTEDLYWSFCNRWLGTLNAQTATVSNIPRDGKTCKHCLRKFNAL